MFNALKMAYYAVARGRQTGIFRSWGECEAQVKGFSGSIYKKFKSQQEAKIYIEEQPADKKQTLQTKINFAKAIQNKTSTTPQETPRAGKRKAEAVDSDDEIFMNLKEYPDEPSTTTVASTSKQSKTDPTSIQFNPPDPTTVKLYNKLKFNEDAKGFVHVYTDGSCISNGKYAAAAGLGVYFGPDNILNVSEPVSGRATNNAGEIQAAIRAIQDAQIYGIKRLNIFTDSHFLINSVCKWMTSWKKKDWRLASGKRVINEKDFRRLDELIESGNMLIKWSYIPAHKGFDGNEEADRLAKLGASQYRSRKDRDEFDEDIPEEY